MNKQFGKELEVIISRIVLGARQEQGFYSSLLEQQPKTLTKEEGKQAILSLFKEMVPESPRTGMEIDDVLDQVEGFEQCRKQILERIGGE